MKFTLIFISLLALIAVSTINAKEFGFFEIVEGSGRINGTETDNKDEISLKAEQAIRRIIDKHLFNKKKNRAQKLEAKREAKEVDSINPKTETPAHIPQSINWDEHQETRDLINQKVTGGTQAINDLISLLKEREEQNKTN